MEQNWKAIWDKRELFTINQMQNDEEIVSSLLRMDGFDSSTGWMNARSWIDFIEKMMIELNLKKNDSVFEIGCGSGAFLYPIYKFGCEVGGLDFSEKLLSVCKSIFVNDDFYAADAKNMSEDKQYDYVVSCGVFFYFPNLTYATEVLQKMYKKARKGILILDVPDVTIMQQCEQHRRQGMSVEVYEEKYKGLPHLYFDRQFFTQQAEQLGAGKIKITQQHIEGYVNNPYRFNVIIEK